MNKKVWLLIFMFMLIIDVKALSFKGGDVIKNVFVLKVKENGEKEYKKGQFIIDGEGDYVYCLEPFVKVNNNSSYNKYTNNFAKNLGLSDELWEKINLISYYGYQYKDDTHNHMDPKWYYITQMLIWQNVSPKARFYFTDTFKGNVNSTLFVNEIKEIYNLVNNHYKIPEFDVPDTYIGDTLSIIDRNGVLKKFEGSKNVKINGNILTIKISDLSNKFTLKKGTNNKAFIFVSSDSQNVLKGKMDVPVIANYDIKGLELKGNIKIKKYGEVIDGDKTSLEGVIFALFDENKNYIKEATTDKDGKAIFGNLKKGKYFIKEVSNDKKFVLDDNYYEANLKVNENNRIIDIFLELENKLKKGDLKIKKIDFDTKMPIKDTEFIIMKDEEVIYQGNTNVDGIIELNDLVYGIYKIKEVMASNGYLLNEMIYEVKIDDENKDVYIEIENELKKGNLKIKKIDFDTKIPIKDTEFIIMKDEKIIYQGKTNADGIIELNDLVYGIYKIKEAIASNGYLLNEMIYEVKIDDENKDVYIEIENELKKGKLVIRKLDSSNGNVISNVEFIIMKDKEVIYEGVTNEYGEIEINNLPLGIYIIKEVRASNGYNLNEDEIEVSLDSEVKYIEIFNIPDTEVRIVDIIMFFEEKKKFLV